MTTETTAPQPMTLPLPVDLSAMNHGELFQWIWNNEIVPAYTDRAKREQERRVDAFAETTLTVCGEEVRMMTPQDLFFLDAVENPFVSGGIPTENDCAFFIWRLHADNDGTNGIANCWRRGRIFQRITSKPDLALVVAEIEEYVDRMLLESSEPILDANLTTQDAEKTEKQPPSTHFISPLLMNVAADIGHIDPMTGRLLGDTPLPRLLQYARDIKRQKSGSNEEQSSLIASLQFKCMSRVNEIIAERKKTVSS